MTKTCVSRGLLSVLVLTIAAVLPANAEEWSKSYNVSANPDLRIETTDANIRVNTWDQNTIEAKVITSRYKIGEGGIQVQEHQTGNSVEIEVRYPHHNMNFGWSGSGHRVDIVVQMPRQGNVNLRTGDGNVELADLKGDYEPAHRRWFRTLAGILMASCTRAPATVTFGRMVGLMNWNSRLVTVTLTLWHAKALRWGPIGGWRVGTAACRWNRPGPVGGRRSAYRYGHIDLEMPVTTGEDSPERNPRQAERGR